MVLDDKSRFIDIKLFDNLFSSYVDKHKKSKITINGIDFNNFGADQTVKDFNNFFLSNRADFSNLFKFSVFHCGNFNVLSEEYFSFYPIIKTHILNAFVNAPEKYLCSKETIAEVFKLNESL
jgi:hypothetical protein